MKYFKASSALSNRQFFMAIPNPKLLLLFTGYTHVQLRLRLHSVLYSLSYIYRFTLFAPAFPGVGYSIDIFTCFVLLPLHVPRNKS